MRILLLLAALAANLAAQIPTPESVLGHKPGDDFYLATYEESIVYFQKLAASTDKLKLINIGKTTQGRDWWVALISNPANLAKITEYSKISGQLANARGLTEQQAHALAASGKAIVHIDGGLHANEVAGAQHTIQLAYELIRDQPKEIFENVILMLWPSINPDGQTMIANWYRQNTGTPYEVSSMPWLYQEYVGHDNNRDSYMNNMIESSTVTKINLEYQPHIVYTQHQTAPFPGRIYIPPFAEPISGNIHPLMLRWLGVVGTSMAAYLDGHGLPGAMHRDPFDVWYPGYLDHIGNFRHTLSFFTETALYRYATPHFYTTDEFPAARRDLRTEVFYASPWKGGWWRLGDAVRYMIEASRSVLDTAAKYRENLLYNRYLGGRDVIAKFSSEPPFAYVIPNAQHDASSAALLVEKLSLSGIEISQATKPFAANGTTYPTGSWVVLMDQPYAGLVKDLFDIQKYPTLSERPYDVTGWTLPIQMGVEALAVGSPISAESRAGLKRLDAFEAPKGRVDGTGSSFAFTRNSNSAYRAVNQILAAGGTASSEGSDFFVGLDRAKLEPIIQSAGLAASAKTSSAKPMRAARVGLYRPWVSSIDEGWTRWIFEQYALPFTNLYNNDIIAGRLSARFDTIVIPDIAARLILDGQRAGTVPDRYAGGLGEAGTAALREFVDQGGTLVTLNGASIFAIDQFQLPVTNVLATLRPTEFSASGCLVRVQIRDTANPLVAGLPKEPAVMFERSPAFETKTGFKGTILASYSRDRNPLLSGYLLGPEKIQGKIAALDVEYGKGHIILLGFRPQWRGQSYGAYKFLFNTLYK